METLMHLAKTIVGGLLATAVAWAKPVLHLDFEDEPAGFEIVGGVSFEAGPRPPEFPDLAKKNRAA